MGISNKDDQFWGECVFLRDKLKQLKRENSDLKSENELLKKIARSLENQRKPVDKNSVYGPIFNTVIYDHY